MPASVKPHPSNSILAYWGNELRKLRLQARMSQRKLARLTCYSTSYVGHVETAKRFPSKDFAMKCDEVFGTDILTRLWGLIGKDSYPTWFRPFLDLEQEARVLRYWAPLLIPGLLQTPDYARALVRITNPRWKSEQVEEAVGSRISRQELLRRDDPPTLLAIIDQATLLRPVGGPAVMRAQLVHLIEMVEAHEHISVQMVPLDVGAHAGLIGPMIVASFRSQPDVVYLESLWRGEVITDLDGVETLSGQLDAIRVLASPQAASLALIRKALQQWT